ncbi:protease inhibitor I42 family protein [Planctomycetota bacterium]
MQKSSRSLWRSCFNWTPTLSRRNNSASQGSGKGRNKSLFWVLRPRLGAGGWEIFRFKTASAGQITLKLVYHRPWENVEPLKTFSIEVIVQ